MKHDNHGEKENNSENISENPNFILWNHRVSCDFLNMCQDFQKQQTSSDNSDWLIIDNDTGQIIYPDK